MDGRTGLLTPKARDDVSEKPSGVRSILTGGISHGWAALLGAGWPLVWVIGSVVQPAPANPDEAVPLWASVLAIVFVSALVATLTAAIVRSRVAVYSGLVVGAIVVADSAACPLTGHHGFGLWWVAQFTLFTGMLGANLAALRLAPRP